MPSSWSSGKGCLHLRESACLIPAPKHVRAGSCSNTEQGIPRGGGGQRVAAPWSRLHPPCLHIEVLALLPLPAVPSTLTCGGCQSHRLLCGRGGPRPSLEQAAQCPEWWARSGRGVFESCLGGRPDRQRESSCRWDTGHVPSDPGTFVAPASSLRAAHGTWIFVTACVDVEESAWGTAFCPGDSEQRGQPGRPLDSVGRAVGLFLCTEVTSQDSGGESRTLPALPSPPGRRVPLPTTVPWWSRGPRLCHAPHPSGPLPSTHLVLEHELIRLFELPGKGEH